MRQISEGGARGEKRRRLRAYGGGAVFLAASLWCAFTLPGYYSRWQDSQLLDSVHMEDRPLDLLPEGQESVVGDKICRIREREGYGLVSRYDLADRARTPDALVIQTWQQLTACVREWKDFGLLPESFMEEYEAGSLEYMSLYRLTGAEMGVYWLQLHRGNVVMDFLMDWEGQCLYSASICTTGEERDWFSGEESLKEEMQEAGSFRVREYCQAEYAQYAFPLEDGGQYGVINLLYEDAEALAVRARFLVGSIYQEGRDRVVDTKYGSGFVVILGDPELWDVINMENNMQMRVYELLMSWG